MPDMDGGRAIKKDPDTAGGEQRHQRRLPSGNPFVLSPLWFAVVGSLVSLAHKPTTRVRSVRRDGGPVQERFDVERPILCSPVRRARMHGVADLMAPAQVSASLRKLRVWPNR